MPDTTLSGTVSEILNKVYDEASGTLRIAGAGASAADITGQFAGSAATFAALPTTDANGDPVSNGDWATLTADDGTNLAGAYRFDGTNYVFDHALGDSNTYATSNLTADASHAHTWDDNELSENFTTGSRAVLADDNNSNSEILQDSTGILHLVEDSATGAISEVDMAAGDFNISSENTNGRTAIKLTDTMQLTTKDVESGAATAGQVLTLVDAATGETDYRDAASDIFTQLSQWSLDNGASEVVEGMFGDLPTAILEDAVTGNTAHYALNSHLPLNTEQTIRIKVKRDSAATTSMLLRTTGAGTRELIINLDDGGAHVSNGGAGVDPVVDKSVVTDNTIEVWATFQPNAGITMWDLFPAVGDQNIVGGGGFTGTSTGTLEVIELDLNAERPGISSDTGNLLTLGSDGRPFFAELTPFESVIPEVSNGAGANTGNLSSTFTPTASGDYIFEYSGDVQQGNGGISVGTTVQGTDLFVSSPASGDADGSRLTLTRQENFTPAIPLTAGVTYHITQWAGGGGIIFNHTVSAGETGQSETVITGEHVDGSDVLTWIQEEYYEEPGAVTVVDDVTGLGSGGDTPFGLITANTGVDINYTASQAGPLAEVFMNLRNTGADEVITLLVRNSNTGETSNATHTVVSGDAFGAAGNDFVLDTPLTTSIGDVIEFEFTGDDNGTVVQRNTNDPANTYSWQFAGLINNPSMGLRYREPGIEHIVRTYDDGSLFEVDTTANTVTPLASIPVDWTLKPEVDNDNQTAAEVSYDNTNSGLTATNTQEAIDELASPTSLLFQTETSAGTLTGPAQDNSFSTFTPHVSGEYDLRHFASSVTGTIGMNIGTTLGGSDIFSSVSNTADRITDTETDRTFIVSLEAETEYFIRMVAGGGSVGNDIGYEFRYRELDTGLDETVYGDEQVDVITTATHDWSWIDSQNFLMTTALAATTINYPTNVRQGDQVSVLFQSTNATGTTFSFAPTITDVNGNALPDLVLGNGEVRRIIFGTTNALFVAALDYPNEVAGLEATKIDSNAGATDEVLAASTNNGGVRLFTNIDVTNEAKLSVQAGETLNGVVDSEFRFSNYSVGTQFRADEVTGGWVVSVVGASTQESLYRWAAENITDDGGINENDYFQFGISWNTVADTTINDATGDAPTFTGAGGGDVSHQFTIPVDGVVDLDISLNFDDDGETDAKWQIGYVLLKNGVRVHRSTTGLNDGGNGTIHLKYQGLVTPADAWQVRCTELPTPETRVTASSIFIKELPTTEAVLAGMVTPTERHSARIYATAAQNIDHTAANLTNTGILFASSTLPVEVEYDAVGVDVGGMADLANNRIVIQKGGRYNIVSATFLNNNPVICQVCHTSHVNTNSVIFNFYRKG